MSAAEISRHEIWTLADWELTKLKTELEHERDGNGRKLSPDLQEQISQSLQAVTDEIAERAESRSRPTNLTPWLRNLVSATDELPAWCMRMTPFWWHTGR